jgi:hypothetical protein
MLLVQGKDTCLSWLSNTLRKIFRPCTEAIIVEEAVTYGQVAIQ